MIRRKERKKMRLAINVLMKEKNCSLEEFYDSVVAGDVRYSTGFRTQLRKMLLEEKVENFKKNLTYTTVKNYKLPIVFCKEKNGRWIFRCSFCQRIHFHSPFPGHHHAHCDGDVNSIFRPHGYFLKLEEKK